MRITEEASWVVLDLLDSKTSTRVGTIGDDASGKRPSQASNRATDVVISHWIGQCNTGRTRRSFHGFVNMRGSKGCTFVLARDGIQGDVLVIVSGEPEFVESTNIADEVLLAIDTEVEFADGARLARRWRRAVDYLIRCGHDFVRGCELERA